MSLFKINPAGTVVVRMERETDTADKAVLEVTCKYLARAERKAWLDRFSSEDEAHLLLEVALGWNVASDAGEPLPLDLDHMKRLLGNFETLAAEFLMAYAAACAEARAKN